MADASLRPSPPADPVSIDQVELVDGQAERLLLRLTGRWRVQPPADPAGMHLAVPNGAGVLRFPAQAPAPRRGSARLSDDPRALVATFSLPEALLPALAGGLSLEFEGGSAVALPPVAPAPRDDEEEPSGQVVDRAVLAERRARRAELGEQSSSRRAAAAEQAATALRAQLKELEQRLKRLDADRAEAQARVEDRDRSLRAAVQRLHAEQRRREEAAEEAARRVQAAEDELQSARRRGAQAERQSGQLSRDVEELRRRAAEAENAVGAAARGRRQAEERAAEAAQRLQALEAARAQALSAQGRLAATVAGSGVLAAEVAALHKALEAGSGPAAPLHSPIPAEHLGRLLTQEGHSRPPRLASAVLRVGGGVALDDAGRVLAEARRTIAHARERLDELERAHSAQAARAEGEQAARLALEEELEKVRAQAAVADGAVSRLRSELERRQEAEARAQALVAGLQEQVGALQAQTEERASSEEATRRLLVEWVAGARAALEDAEARIAEALQAAADAEEELARERAERSRLEHRLAVEGEEHRAEIEQAGAELEGERRLRIGLERALEQEVARRCDAERRAADEAESRSEGEGRLRERLAEATEAVASLQRRVDELTAGQEAERTRTLELLAAERQTAEAAEASRDRLQLELQRRAAAQARAEWRSDELSAQLVALRAQLAGARSPAPGPAVADEPWLVRGLRIMAREDPAAAAALLLQVAQAQEPPGGRILDYDLEIAGGGRYAVTVGPEGAEMRPIAQPRPDAEVGFRLWLDAAALLELLLHGGSPRLRRSLGVRVRATRRPRRALRALGPVPFDPAALAARGVWLDPRLCLRALTLLIDPAWTRGQAFVVAQQIEGEPWYVRIDDGLPPRVTEVPPPTGPAATVQLSRSCFQRLLGGDSSAGEKAAIRGDVRAVHLLAQWVARAQGAGARAPG